MKKAKWIVLFVLIAALALMGAKRSAWFVSTTTSGVDDESLSGSPETDAITLQRGNTFLGEMVLFFSINSGTTQHVSATVTHSPDNATWHEAKTCQYQAGGSFDCLKRYDYFPITSGVVTHHELPIVNTGKALKVQFTGDGDSEVTVKGYAFQP